MSTYNGAKFLKESVDSVLSQTFRDFEFIIIDDGSTDESVDILGAIYDPRVIVIKNDTNIGLTKSLNKGIRHSQGYYIIRMDADDVALAHRFQTQYEFMESHSEVGACGSAYKMLHNHQKIIKQPLTHDEIMSKLLFNSAIAHPTAIIRKSVMTENNIFYDETKEAAQDYDLWSRVGLVSGLANIEEPLLLYREHQESISKTKKDKQLATSMQVRSRLLDKVSNELTIEDKSIHEIVAGNDKKMLKKYKKEAMSWLDRLVELNKMSHFVDEEVFKIYINQKKQSVKNSSQSSFIKEVKKLWARFR
jgi:glycosyltransferase involved in cell wall biosynthesis